MCVLSEAESADQLYEAGMDALDDEDYRLALRLGLRLKRRRHSSAFEILARAYRGLDREDRAITILEKGVELAPDVGMLWHQLGCYYSDNEHLPRVVWHMTAKMH
ncbi:MAG: hypothetical protein ACE5EQ_12785 [Phycisphaerae bacterium]